MSKDLLRKLIVSWVFTILLFLLFIFLSYTKTYRILELKAFDLIFSLKKEKPSKNPILHIDIDDRSLQELGRWPWPRRYHAQLVDILTECGARQVIMDILFTEKYRDNPKEDTQFASCIGKGCPVYLPFYFTEEEHKPSKELYQLLLKDVTVSLEDAAGILKKDPDSFRREFFTAKKYVLDEAIHTVIEENPSRSADEVLSAIEDRYNWFLFPEEEEYIRKHLNYHKELISFVKRFGISYKEKIPLALRKGINMKIPVSVLCQHIKGTGFINAEPDEDGVLRRIPLFIEYENKLFPYVSVAAILDLLKVEKIDFSRKAIIFKNAHIKGEIKDIVIPVDERGRMLINWRGAWQKAFRHVSYYSIIKLSQLRNELSAKIKETEKKGKLSSQDKALIQYLRSSEEVLKKKLIETLKGKICIVGLTATGTHDMGPIPLDTDYPYVGTHSNLLDTILAQKFLRRASNIAVVGIFLFTALIMGVVSLMRLWKGVVFVLFYVGVYLSLVFLFLHLLGLWIGVMGTLGIVVFSFAGIMSIRFFTEEKEKAWIKKAFSHYMAPDVMNELLKDPSKLRLGGERRVLTVLFSDIKSFTSYSEKRKPEEVVKILNEYLDVMTRVIFENKGTLDKYVGDEIMAIFGAPRYEPPEVSAKRAVKTAVDMMEKLAFLQDKWAQEGYEALDIGIGINTGEMVVGNMGSSLVMDYTVIGDAVNLGARIEALTRKYNNNIIISEFTYQYVKDMVEVNPLEPIKVKGKDIPVMMYEVVRLKEEIKIEN
ncbi:MAG: CHASE2 domain-containing protein [Candidatus Omnitrophica bacterium]|nr:CHASE2 domain-containing protein [Candidatus Omnitrophota bacterium]